MISRESWVEVQDFPRYAVSSHGRVMNQLTGRILRQTVGLNGRMTVSLRNEREIKTFRVCRLVWNSFFDEDASGLSIGHIDEDKTNNAIWNLELVSQRRELTPVKDLTTGETFPSVGAAARKFGVPYGRIAYAARNPHRNVLGHHFELVDEDAL